MTVGIGLLLQRLAALQNQQKSKNKMLRELKTAQQTKQSQQSRYDYRAASQALLLHMEAHGRTCVSMNEERRGHPPYLRVQAKTSYGTINAHIVSEVAEKMLSRPDATAYLNAKMDAMAQKKRKSSDPPLTAGYVLVAAVCDGIRSRITLKSNRVILTQSRERGKSLTSEDVVTPLNAQGAALYACWLTAKKALDGLQNTIAKEYTTIEPAKETKSVEDEIIDALFQTHLRDALLQCVECQEPFFTAVDEQRKVYRIEGYVSRTHARITFALVQDVALRCLRSIAGDAVVDGGCMQSLYHAIPKHSFESFGANIASMIVSESEQKKWVLHVEPIARAQ